jgi:hypothetical protein
MRIVLSGGLEFTWLPDFHRANLRHQCLIFVIKPSLRVALCFELFQARGQSPKFNRQAVTWVG